MQRRFDKIGDASWIAAMTIAIGGTEASGFFRFFDSGDVQSVKMLEDIVQIAKNLPHIAFWLPTKELLIVSQYVKKNGAFPVNLTVRLSAFMLEGKAPIAIAEKYGVVASAVSKGEFTCPSSNQGNKCLTCRNCWDRNVAVVTYKQH
jgi:hypothetical protein